MAKLLKALHPDWTRIEAANADKALTVLTAKEAVARTAPVRRRRRPRSRFS